MSKFYEQMAEVFEVEQDDINSEFRLYGSGAEWDSLALVSTIAAVDECFDVMLDGKALAACQTIGDIERLVEQAGKR